MSICSQMSNMSVSYCGSEIQLADAIDECFTELQGHLNHLHSYTRELAMMPEQDSEYEVELKQVLIIEDCIDEMSELFKDLKSVTKQIIGKPPKDEKERMKKLVDDHRAERKRMKEREKEEQKLSNTSGGSASH